MKSRVLLLALFAFGSLAPVLAAHWGSPKAVPIERILPQLEARVAKDQNDAHGQYLLGRVHGAAFARGMASVRLSGQYDRIVLDQRKAGSRPVASSIDQASGLSNEVDRLSPEAACNHLTAAVRHLSRAVELAPGDALYQIGFANALDAGAHLAPMVDSTAMASQTFGPLGEEAREKVLERLRWIRSDGLIARGMERELGAWRVEAIPLLNTLRADQNAARQAAVGRLLIQSWRDLALAHYERAFALAFATDGKLAEVHRHELLRLTSYEAAISYIRLAKARKSGTEADVQRLAQIEAGLTTLKSIPLPSYVTPVLIPDRSGTSLAQHFDGSSANFDLAGIGEQQEWPWPTADASFLVWDPDCEGAIRSGRQLIGSSTWWMFFEDGYRALEALDVDGDSWLRAAELDGLALWRDTDRNGVCEGGEVESLQRRGIVALSARADGIDPDDCISPISSRGVLYEDGSMRLSFDWVATREDPRP